MMFVHITKVEIYSLIGYDVECGYDAYTLVTFSDKQMARTTTIFETKSSAIWSYNPDDPNMRFELDIEFVRSAKGVIELKVMHQNNLRPDEPIGSATGSLPVELANDGPIVGGVMESGPDLELSLFILDAYGTRIGCMAVTLHRHIYTAEQKLQKDLKPDRKQSKRPSLQINAKSERSLIAALASEPPPDIQPLIPQLFAEYAVGDKVLVKKAVTTTAGLANQITANGANSQPVQGEIFAANKDGTYMVKLADGRVYNRVTVDRISKIEDTTSFNQGDKVYLKKAGAQGSGSGPGTKMAGEVFAKNKDGTYMVKLSDGRVYNRVTIDRLSKESSRPSSRRPSDLGQITQAFLSEDALATLDKAAKDVASANQLDFKANDRIVAVRDESQPDVWVDARVLAYVPNAKVIDVRFLKDGFEVKEMPLSRVKKAVTK
jgi:hypothetical protein